MFCSLRYPAFNAHAPYYIVTCGPTGCTIFLHVISYMVRFSKKKKLLIINRVFRFSLQLSCETFSHSKKNSARYDHKCILVFMYSTRYSCQMSMKLEFSRHIFGKTQISNFIKIRPVGAELFHAGWRTDGQTDSTTLKAASSNFFLNAPKKNKLRQLQ